MLPTIIAAPGATETIQSILCTLGEDVCDLLADVGGRIVLLEHGQRFDEVSPVLRRIVAGVDSWPIPPAGLFCCRRAHGLSALAIADDDFA
jgi:hypothetical protein